MPGSLTRGFLWSRWRGKRPRHSRRVRKRQFYVAGKRPMSSTPYLRVISFSRLQAILELRCTEVINKHMHKLTNIYKRTYLALFFECGQVKWSWIKIWSLQMLTTYSRRVMINFSKLLLGNETQAVRLPYMWLLNVFRLKWNDRRHQQRKVFNDSAGYYYIGRGPCGQMKPHINCCH